MNLFLFYKLSFVVSVLSSSTLTLIGKHYYSRGIILEVFFLSQLALLGNLLDKLIFHSEGSGITGILLSYMIFGAGKYFFHRMKIDRHKMGTLMVGGYLFTISLQYLMISFFPQLDSHMSIGFFGNMVTASFNENLFLIIAFSTFLTFYTWSRKSINKNTLEINILGSKDQSLYELMLFSIPLVISLYSLGFLYVMSFLLLPTLILGSDFSSEKRAASVTLIISALASFTGLGLSIFFERLSTTSVQICLLTGLLLGIKALSRK